MFVRGYDLQKRLEMGQITFIFYFILGIESLSWTAQSGQCFPKIRGGEVFFF